MYYFQVFGCSVWTGLHIHSAQFALHRLDEEGDWKSSDLGLDVARCHHRRRSFEFSRTVYDLSPL